ncbi:hypothetical protein ABIB49_001155 [Arthrobacter sp. UYCu512]
MGLNSGPAAALLRGDMPTVSTHRWAQQVYAHSPARTESMSTGTGAHRQTCPLVGSRLEQRYASERWAMVAVARRCASGGTSRMMSSRKR